VRAVVHDLVPDTFPVRRSVPYDETDEEDRMNSGLAARLGLVVVLSGLAAGCSLAAGIFKAGVWVGIVLAMVLVVGVMLLFRGRR
jgi:hypothetical protein